MSLAERVQVARADEQIRGLRDLGPNHERDPWMIRGPETKPVIEPRCYVCRAGISPRVKCGMCRRCYRLEWDRRSRE